MHVLEELKHGFEEAWETFGKGWQRLRQQAAGAVTRFKSNEHDILPTQGGVGPSQRLGRWAVLAGDVYEDEKLIGQTTITFVRLYRPCSTRRGRVGRFPPVSVRATSAL